MASDCGCGPVKSSQQECDCPGASPGGSSSGPPTDVGGLPRAPDGGPPGGDIHSTRARREVLASGGPLASAGSLSRTAVLESPSSVLRADGGAAGESPAPRGGLRPGGSVAPGLRPVGAAPSSGGEPVVP